MLIWPVFWNDVTAQQDSEHPNKHPHSLGVKPQLVTQPKTSFVTNSLVYKHSHTRPENTCGPCGPHKMHLSFYFSFNLAPARLTCACSLKSQKQFYLGHWHTILSNGICCCFIIMARICTADLTWNTCSGHGGPSDTFHHSKTMTLR